VIRIRPGRIREPSAGPEGRPILRRFLGAICSPVKHPRGEQNKGGETPHRGTAAWVPMGAQGPEPCAFGCGLLYGMPADVEDRVPPRTLVRERLAAVIVAVALGVTSFVFAARAFRGVSTSGHTVKLASPTIANGLLAFSGGPPGIYTMGPDGTGVTNLTGLYDGDVVVAAYGPRWSPDGTRIAFYGYPRGAVDGGANYDIYVMNGDGTGVTNLTTSPADIATRFSQGNPTWSPDGTKIAYDGDDGLYVMSADGSDQTKIADGQDSSWSPDGTRIAFEMGVQGESSDLFTVHPDGTGLTQLTNLEGGEELPSWSPDATRIAFLHTQDHQATIYVMNADGTGLVSVFEDQGVYPYRPLWSPGGTRLIFEAEVTEPPGTNGGRDYTYDIYAVSPDGTGAVDLTPTKDRDENSPVWAPDGSKIAFEASTTLNGDNTGTYDIYVMNPDGTGEQRLTPDQHSGGFDLSWQPVTGTLPTSSP
jgi:Tol biopolymer transport system component